MKKILLMIFPLLIMACKKDLDLKTDSPLVIISSSIQANGVASPWAKSSVQKNKFYGVFITSDIILTTSKAVGNWVHLEMSRFRSEEKYDLEVLHADFESNLALVKVKDIKSLPYITPAGFSDDLEIGDGVVIKTLNENLQVVEETAALESFESIKSVTSTFKMLSYKFNFSKKIKNMGEIALFDGKIAGIVTNKDNDFQYVVPGFILKHYVEEVIKDNEFRGFSSLGFDTENLFSRLYRSYLKVSSEGIRITLINPNGAFADDVYENDVLVEIAGKKIDEYGYVSDTRWGRVFYLSYLNYFKVGDLIEIKVNRMGEELIFEQKLRPYNSNEKMISSYQYNKKEPHLIFGGVVFQELSFNYLVSWGSKWWKKAPSEMVQLWNLNPYVKHPEKKRYIVVNRVLADTFNRGYRRISDKIVLEVNQKRVFSIDDVRKALKTPVLQQGKKYMKATFTEGNGMIVLGYEKLEEAHNRITKKFDVNFKESFFKF